MELGFKKVQLFLGTGGVGKTSLASAYALKIAKENPALKVKLITIDPSNRLKTFFGIEKGEYSAQIKNLKVALNNRGASIEAFISDAAARKGLDFKSFKSNKIFQSLVKGLSVSQEFTSLYEIKKNFEDENCDLLVVDTPPLQNAADFLESSMLLKAFFSASLAKFFLSEDERGILYKVLNVARRKSLEILGRLTGSNFVNELSLFFKVIEAVRPEIINILDGADGILKTETGVRLVCNYNQLSLLGMRLALRGLAGKNLQIESCYFNKFSNSDEASEVCSSIVAAFKEKYSGVELLNVPAYPAGLNSLKDLEGVFEHV